MYKLTKFIQFPLHRQEYPDKKSVKKNQFFFTELFRF